MSENIEEILEKLRARVDGPAIAEKGRGSAASSADVDDKSQIEFVAAGHSGVTALNHDQITSAVYVIAPAQISYVAEMFANAMAGALNMRAMAPRIRQIAEQSLRKALGAAKKQGTGHKG